MLNLTVVCDDRNYFKIKASRRYAKHRGRHSLYSGKYLFIIVITIYRHCRHCQQHLYCR